MLSSLEATVSRLNYLLTQARRLNELYANLRTTAVARYMGYEDSFIEKQERLNVEAYGEDYRSFYAWSKWFYHYDLEKGAEHFVEPLEMAMLYAEDVVVSLEDSTPTTEQLACLTSDGTYAWFDVKQGTLESELWKRFREMTVALAEVRLRKGVDITTDLTRTDTLQRIALRQGVEAPWLSSRGRWEPPALIGDYLDRVTDRDRRYDFQRYFLTTFMNTFNISRYREELEAQLSVGLESLADPTPKIGMGAVIQLLVLTECALPYYRISFTLPSTRAEWRQLQLQHKQRFDPPSFEKHDEVTLRLKDTKWLDEVAFIVGNENLSLRLFEIYLFMYSLLQSCLDGHRCFSCPFERIKRLEWSDDWTSRHAVVEPYECKLGRYVGELLEVMVKLGVVRKYCSDSCCVGR